MKKKPYMAIADHLAPKSYQDIADAGGTNYNTLQDAYDAYVKKITEDYSNFKDTLPKN